MSEILSQDEIDALMAQVASDSNILNTAAPQPFSGGGAAVMTEDFVPTSGAASWLFDIDNNEDEEDYSEKRLKLYDFSRPERVSKDQTRILENMYDNYARQYTNTLTNYLRTLVDVRLASIEQFTYKEYIMYLSNMSCIHLFRMEPIETTAIFEINPALVFLIIDRLFGGFGKPVSNNNELTPIVQNVIRKIVSRGLDDLATVWEHLGDFSPKITNFETNPMFIQIAPPNETVILITFEVTIAKSTATMSICFPHKIIEKLFSSMTSESWINARVQTTVETRKVMEEEIQELKVPLSVLVGQTRLTVRDLLQLEKGDILCLDKHKDEDLIVQIGGKSKMSGKSGIVGRKKAVKIMEIIEPEVPGITAKYGRGSQNEQEEEEEEE
jgi:flagellar motor switch protein FliM